MRGLVWVSLTACRTKLDAAATADAGDARAGAERLEDSRGVKRCRATTKRALDPVDIESVALEGDTLSVDVAYRGSCRAHAFQLCEPGDVSLTIPAQIDLELLHQATPGAPANCSDEMRQSLRFDVSTLHATPARAGRVLQLNLGRFHVMLPSSADGGGGDGGGR